MIELCECLEESSGIEFIEGGTVNISSIDEEIILKEINYCIINNIRHIIFNLRGDKIDLKLEINKDNIKDRDKYWLTINNKLEGFFSIYINKKGLESINELIEILADSKKIVDQLYGRLIG